MDLSSIWNKPRDHVSRLEQIFDELDETPTGKHCKGMEGLIKEGGEAAEEDYEGDAKDAALIGAAQRVEHYEIAAYGTVRAMAEKLGEDKAVNLLSQTLQEEKDTDVKLSKVADKMTNRRQAAKASRKETRGREKQRARLLGRNPVRPPASRTAAEAAEARGPRQFSLLKAWERNC